MINVTVWNEYYHEKTEECVSKIYPHGIHQAIADFLKCDEINVRTATLDDEECGLTEDVINNTDVLIWWGHMRHDLVPDEIAERVHSAVLKGMGIIFLHSAHHSKPFKLLMGTPCNLTWRENGDSELLWVLDPSHPITKGIDRYIELEHEETYGEPFIIPEPDKLLLIGSYEGGEAFRAGAVWQRCYGKVFYFQPGHETFPTFYNKDVQTVIKNAVHWCKSDYRVNELLCPQVEKVRK